MFKQPPTGFAVGFIPSVYTVLFGHVSTLVNFCMAGKAQSGNTVIMGLDSPSLSIPQLVGMSGNHRTVLRPADLTR